MNDVQAIRIRKSRRKYNDIPIKQDTITKISKLIEEINNEAKTNIQLVMNNPEAFNSIFKSYGIFVGAKHFIALVAKNEKQIAEQIGYYGEKIVLELTKEKIGTCWVSGTFDRKVCRCTLNEDEKIHCIITFGNVDNSFSFKEKVMSYMAHRKSKEINDMYLSTSQVPKWFLNGMELVKLAPSALNRQPVKFKYDINNITAKVDNYESCAIDLGIAKLHFEIGSGCGKWNWGNNAKFITNI